jgi:hypothetical protein
MNKQTETIDLAQQAAASLNVPSGVSGKQRNLFLALTDEQKGVYRYHFIACGRPAAICHRVATTGQV